MDEVAQLLHARFVAWADEVNQGYDPHKRRKRWASFRCPWEELGEGHRGQFLALADEIAVMTEPEAGADEVVATMEPEAGADEVVATMEPEAEADESPKKRSAKKQKAA